MKISIKNARLAFPELFVAKAVNGEGDPAYSATFLIPADDPQVQEILDAMTKVAEAKWRDKAATMLSQMRKQDRLCLRDGADKAHYAGFAGHMYISARSKVRPMVVDRDRSLLTRDDGRPYGGCFVNGKVELWAQDNQYGKRINATLSGVQFVRDGEAFTGGGAPIRQDDFEDLSTDHADDLI